MNELEIKWDISQNCGWCPYFNAFFYRGYLLKKRVSRADAKSRAHAGSLMGLLGASSGDHHRANFRLKSGGGHILHVWSLSSRRKSDQKTGHAGNHASYALLRLSCSGYIECKACPFGELTTDDRR